MKIRAYTLMEVTIAMLISAICITICYTAYSLIGHYFQAFSDRNEIADRIISLRQVMQTDFLKSNHVIKSEEGFILSQDSTFVHYQFGENAILRQFDNIHTDTFALKYALLETYLEQQEAFETDTVDQVKFTVFLDKNTPVSMQFDKYYSAQNLFR